MTGKKRHAGDEEDPEELVFQPRISARCLVALGLGSCSMLVVILYNLGWFLLKFIYQKTVIRQVLESEEVTSFTESPRTYAPLLMALALAPSVALGLHQLYILNVVRTADADQVYLLVRHGSFAHKVLPLTIFVTLYYTVSFFGPLVYTLLVGHPD